MYTKQGVLLVDDDWTEWYPRDAVDGLPLELDWFEGVVPRDFAALLLDAAVLSPASNPYHGPDLAHAAAQAGCDALGAFFEHEPARRPPAGLIEAAQIAFLLLNASHPQASFWCDVRRFDLRPPVRGLDDLTIEQFTAKLARDFAEQRGFSTHQQSLIEYLVKSTTPDADSREARRLGLTRIQVRGVLGLIARIAELLPARDRELSIGRDVALMCGESTAAGTPKTLAQWLKRRALRLAKLEAALDRLDASVNDGFTQRLGWRDRLIAARGLTSELRHPGLAQTTLAMQLRRYGHALTNGGEIGALQPRVVPGQIRTLAVLHARIVDATVTIGEPRDVHERITTLRRVLTAVVEGHDLKPADRPQRAGIPQWHGERLLAVFSTANAAIDCALRLHEASPHGLGIGIDVGAVHVQDHLYAGTRVTLAGRLSDRAEAMVTLHTAAVAEQSTSVRVAGRRPPRKEPIRGFGQVDVYVAELRRRPRPARKDGRDE